MAHIITLAGSPSAHSRSTRLLSEAEALLREAGFSVQRFSIEDFPPADLLRGGTDSPAAQALNAAIEEAGGLLIASPVYQASFTAGLKGILDQIRHRGLRGKVVMSLSTSGSVASRHALELSLLPVLRSLEARHIEPGLNVPDKDFPSPAEATSTGVPDEIRIYLRNGLATFCERVDSAQTTLV